MKFHLITTVWGDWHIGAMEKVMLPTLLAEKNLPALREIGEVRYRFLTVRKDVARIESLPLFSELKKYTSVDITVASEEDNPPDYVHLQWWNDSLAEAKKDGAIVVFIPPDVVWSDCAVGNMGKCMANGKKSVSMPYIRVMSETCISEISGRYERNKIVSLSPYETVKMALRHLHPLTASIFPKIPHTHPTMELYWNVKGEGCVLRAVNREATAFDPTYRQSTKLIDPKDPIKIEDIHFVTDSDDMIMLSLVPMTKDMGNIGIYLPDYRLQPIDIANHCLHPANYTPYNSIYASQKIRLHYKKPTESLWKKAEARSDATFRQAIVQFQAIRIWTAMRDAGYKIAAKIFALALQATAFARRWREEKPLIIFAPEDAAFEKYTKEKLHQLIQKGSEHHLLDFIYDHIAVYENESDGVQHLCSLNGKKHTLQKNKENHLLDKKIQLSKAISFERHTIYIVSQLLYSGVE